MELGGVTLLQRSVAAVEASGVVDAIVVAVPAELVAEATELLPGVTVVAGGAERSDSVRAGLTAAPDCDLVLVHDAARALTPPALFGRVVEALKAGAAAVVPGLPVADTLKAVDDDDRVAHTVDRAPLRAIQTPQGFTAEALRRAHATAADATDDAGLLEALGTPVTVVPGEPLAFKITTPFDLRIAELLCVAGGIDSPPPEKGTAG